MYPIRPVQGDISLSNDNLLAVRTEEEIEVVLGKAGGLAVGDHIQVTVDGIGLVLDGRNGGGDHGAVCQRIGSALTSDVR